MIDYSEPDAPIDRLIWQHIADSPCSEDFRDYLRHSAFLHCIAMKTFLKFAAVALITSIVSGYIGYSYAVYEGAFYCEKQKASRVAI